MIPYNSFNFSLYTYEVIFQEVDTNWWERWLTGRHVKLKYTIRERGGSKTYYLSYDGRFMNSQEPQIWWDNPTEPQNEIIRAKLFLNPSSDNVVFSSKDLN